MAPLKKEELSLLQKQALAEDVVKKLAAKKDIPQEDIKVCKAFYCLWLKMNGSVAVELKDNIGSFTSWLDCGF